jgi:Tol biopolymer transport system component
MLVNPGGEGLRKLPQIQSLGLAWTPDGKSLLLCDRDLPSDSFSVYQMPVTGGERRRLTFPPPGSWGDIFVSPAPDGARFAFSRYATKGDGDVYISAWDGSEVRRLTREQCWTTELAFTPDGEHILIHAARHNGSGLWQIPAGGGALHRVPGTTDLDGVPSLSHSRRREPASLVFHRELFRSVLRMIALDTGRVSDVRPIGETPDWSVDGRRIAFSSSSGISLEIWTSAPDGSGARPITRLNSSYTTREPRWSPDGQHIAFTSAAGGNRAVYVVDAKGGQPRRLTADSFNEGSPSWSVDGRFIYFRSERSGVPRLYKVGWPGLGAPIAVGQRGFEAFESPNGNRVYFLKSADRSKVYSMPVLGGPEIEVPGIPYLQPGLWGVISQGIYFVPVDGGQELRLSPLAGGPSRILSRLPVKHAETVGCSLRGDGKAFLWGQQERTHEVWMIRNFRWWTH